MRSNANRFSKPSAVSGAILVALLGFSASAGTDRLGPPAEARFPTDKAIRLQIRISEAKRKPDSVRYYKSVARCRTKGEEFLSSSLHRVRDKRLKRSSSAKRTP